MIDPRRRRFSSYLRLLADRIGLRDWTVGILDGAPDHADAIATIDCRPGRKLAWVSLSDDFLDASPGDQRQTLVHELIHCHFRQADTLAHKIILTTEGFEGFRLAMEYGVDALADVLAPLLPLPDEVKARARRRKPARKHNETRA